jgi:type IV pilus assembly protein PilB
MDSAKTKEILLRENYLTAEDIAKAEKATEGKSPDAIISYLLNEKLITKQLLSQAIAESYGVHFIDIEAHSPSTEIIQTLPEEFARLYHAVLLSNENGTVTVISDDPSQEKLKEELARLFPGKKFVFLYAMPEDIELAFVAYRKPLTTRFGEIVKKNQKFAPEIIDQILEDASVYHASDIHFEPHATDAVIRFRIDGVLHEAGRISREYYENIVNRIKVEAHLRIDEHAAAQDGALHYDKNGMNADFRISIVPVIEGEKIAMRMLSEYVASFSLAEIGVSAAQEKTLQESVKKPFNLILVVGPTGSGKTTLLYTLVKLLNRPEVNVMTIEDPVEYKIPGANQIQVNEATNLTFASALRSIVRQDPDVILVGEIRDKDTAEIAVNAALTGHLILSTFHATDAATALPRLLEMGVEPFLIVSTIEVVVAKRLVRTICHGCRFGTAKSIEEIRKVFPEAEKYLSKEEMILYAGKGCYACHGSGYRGRIGIHEIIRMTKEMRALVLQHPSADEIWKLAHDQGSQSLFEDGLEKVKAGITTLEELLRVASPSRDQ